MNKIFIIGIVCLVIVSVISVSALLVDGEEKIYSFDDDGKTHNWRVTQQPPLKTLITKDEYNKIFKDYQKGILSKSEASNKLKSVRID